MARTVLVHRDMRTSIESEEGSALLLVLLVSVVLLGLGLTLTWLAAASMNAEGHLTRRHEALNAAEVGAAQARHILSTTAGDWDGLLGSASGVACSSTDHDPVKGNILCDPVHGALEGVQVVPAGSQTAASAPGLSAVRYTVYIRNDDIETGVGRPFDDQDRQVVIYVEGVARDGLSTVGVEVVLAQM
jgi:hypothetical protein